MRSTMNLAARVAVNVRRLRDKKEWTLAHLSEIAGVSESHIALVEAGLRSPSLGVIQKLADGLGVDVAELGREVKS